MFNPDTFCMYQVVLGPVIQWLSFVAVYYIWFSFIVLYMNQAASLLVWIVLHLSYRGILKLTIRYRFCSLLKAIRWHITVTFYIIWFMVESCLIGNHTTSPNLIYLFLHPRLKVVGYTVLPLSVRPSIRPSIRQSIRPSVRPANILSSHLSKEP